MLFLKHAADESAQGALQVPVDDTLAEHLERALLTGDEASRLQELTAALVANEQFKYWVLRTAEVRQRRTVNQPKEAAAWLARNLALELATSLKESAPPEPSNAEWRLTALVKKLAECSRLVNDF